MKFDLAIVVAVLAVAASGALAQAQWKEVGRLGQRHMMVVDAAAAGDERLLKQAAAKTCASGHPCVVAFWLDVTEVPNAMPMTAAQQQAMVAQYIRNPAAGKEELLLKCGPGDEASGTKCLH